MTKPVYHDLANPITAAVLPLKVEAVARAEKDAVEYVAKLIAKLEAADWNLDEVAPYPNSLRESREGYMTKKRRRDLFSSFTATDKTRGVGKTYRSNDGHFVVKSPEAEARFVKAAIENAEVQYDAFVAKLVAKIGEVSTASIAGSHVWGYSTLTVTKADGTVERWKTQQIVNVSVYGLLFNQ